MFERDKVMWHTLEGGADWSYNNWRDRYLRQYHLNQTIQQRRQRVCLPSAPRNSAIRHFAYIFYISCANAAQFKGNEEKSSCSYVWCFKIVVLPNTAI